MLLTLHASTPSSVRPSAPRLLLFALCHAECSVSPLVLGVSMLCSAHAYAWPAVVVHQTLCPPAPLVRTARLPLLAPLASKHARPTIDSPSLLKSETALTRTCITVETRRESSED